MRIHVQSTLDDESRMSESEKRSFRRCRNRKKTCRLSGLRLEVLDAGTTGSYPKKGASVSVHYEGFLADGTKFDSTRKRGAPFTFTIGAREVIPGLDEGISRMSIGSRAKLTIPPEHAYGDKGFPGLVPPNSTLIFDIVLLSCK